MRVWLYCAVSGSSNTVAISSVMIEVGVSSVQVTVVAGPPVEVQVRVNCRLNVSRSESRFNDREPN